MSSDRQPAPQLGRSQPLTRTRTQNAVSLLQLQLLLLSSASLAFDSTSNFDSTSSSSFSLDSSLPSLSSFLSPVSAQLMASEIGPLVDRHNFYRSQVGASDMIALEWDPDIAAVAQSYADTCPSGHSFRDGYGENLAWSWPTGNILQSLDNGWVGKEKPFFVYNDPDQCSTAWESCGHYTQIIWAKTSRFGCGARYNCPNMLGRTSPGVVFVCNFQEPGNVFISPGTMMRSYQQGAPCSACDRTMYPYCVNGLCSTRAADAATPIYQPVQTSSKPHTSAAETATAGVQRHWITTFLASLTTTAVALVGHWAN